MKQSPKNKGIALISVLMFIILLATFAGAIVLIIRANVTNGATRAQSYLLQYAAEGGINKVLYQALNSPLNSSEAPQGLKYDTAGISIIVTLESETGKIDINKADESLLRATFQWIGESTEEATSIAQKIIDWRDAGNTRLTHGAEAADYLSAGYSQTPRNDLFQTAGELLNVMFVTQKQFKCLAPFLTVYSGLGMPLQGQTSGPVSEILNLMIDGSSSSSGLQRSNQGFGNQVYTILSKATKGDKSISLRAVIRITNNQKNPYYIHSWRLVDARSNEKCEKK